MIFVALEWRGKLNVASMRIFPDEEKALEYLKELAAAGESISVGFFRAYRLFPDKPPENLTRKLKGMI